MLRGVPIRSHAEHRVEVSVRIVPSGPNGRGTASEADMKTDIEYRDLGKAGDRVIVPDLSGLVRARNHLAWPFPPYSGGALTGRNANAYIW
ncbi:hypothetical protein ABT061_02305 [Streptosporangium sp. NPDC002544]|uniref:hypothetical protein n=1 Tax=Streptosporangium sp. NPDC002544 TaxID=3154538 RepID=UPI003323F207